MRLLVYRGDGWGPMFTISDGKQRLEERLNEFVIKLLRAVQEERRREVQRRLWTEERAEQDRLHRRREEARKAEEARVRQFLDDAAAWSHFAELRRFIDAVCAEAGRRSGDGQPDNESAAWLRWAEAYVETICPLGSGKPLPRIMGP